MFGAFRDRRPWAASLLCLVFSPVFGMLYLNRGRFAFLYWLGSVLFVVFFLALWPMLFSAKISGLAYLIGFPINVMGSIHGFFLAKGWLPETRLKWYAHWYSVLGIALLFPALLAVCIRTFLYQPFDIPGTSMTPSLNRGDYFWVSKRAYDLEPPRRGDVVVFWTEQFHSNFVKRIVGLPGDRVQMMHGLLFLNGEQVPTRNREKISKPCDVAYPCKTTRYEEQYPGGKTALIIDQMSEGPLDNTPAFEVPPDAYYVLGDNRDNSVDSREIIGFVPRNLIIGRAVRKFFAEGRWVWQPVQ